MALRMPIRRFSPLPTLFHDHNNYQLSLTSKLYEAIRIQNHIEAARQ